jgi:tetratricopeptide (TPR) repeat protein
MSKKNIGPILVIFLISFGLYAPNLNNGLFWDDNDWIVGNAFVHDFSHLKEIFSENILAGFGLNSNYYRPLLLLSFAFNYIISGVKPMGYHLVSNGFHIANAILIFIICFSIFRRKLPSFIASLLFAIHPLQVEAVAYISGRGDPMSVFFMLVSLWFFIKINTRAVRRRLYWTLSLMAMILALLSRETSVLLAPLLLIFYISFLSRDKFLLAIKGGIYKTWPFFVISLVYGLLRLTVLNFQNTLNFYGGSNIYTDNLLYRIYTFGHVFLEYLKLIFVSVNLHMERDFPIHTSLFQWPVWLGFLAMIGIVVVGVIFYRRERSFKNEELLSSSKDIHRRNRLKNNKLLENGEWEMENSLSHFRIWFFSWGWFFVALSMVSGIIPINAIIYEHWLYLPSIGFFILASFYIGKFLSDPQALQRCPLYKGHLCRAIFWLFWALFVLYMIFFSTQTVKRNIIWGNPIKFYEEILKYSPGSIRILNNLGNTYSDNGRLDDAMKMYQKIIDNPGNFFAQPYYNLGNIYRDKGDIEEAVSLYKAALEKDPTFPFAYQNLAVIYANSGRLREAAEMLEKYKIIKPQDAGVYYNLGLIYKVIGDRKKAIENLEYGLKVTGTTAEMNQVIQKLLGELK